MRTLSSLALAAANAENSDEVWLIRLTINHANIADGPLRFVNDMQALEVFPTNVINEPDMTAWTLSDTTASALGNSLFRVEDQNTGVTGSASVATSGLSSGQTYTHAIFVRRDNTPKTERFPRLRVSDANGDSNIYLDTNTGEIVQAQSGTGHVAGGIVEAGDAWLVYISRTGATDSTLSILPAVGADATLGTIDSAATGSVVCYRPTLFQGLIADRTTYIAFPFQLDLPGEDTETTSVARLRIDNVDRQIVEAIRGLPSGPTADIEVVLASQPETVEIGYYDLTIRAADYDALYVEASMTYEQIFTEPLTAEMTPARFPGLF